MSFELGLPVGFYGPEDRQHDLVYIKEWLQHIDDKFSMVRVESVKRVTAILAWSGQRGEILPTFLAW
jgi:hypothetical protein